jgi:hypothetical protein
MRTRLAIIFAVFLGVCCLVLATGCGPSQKERELQRASEELRIEESKLLNVHDKILREHEKRLNTRLNIGEPIAYPGTPEARGQRVFLTHIRGRISRHLVTSGFFVIDGDAKPLTEEQAAKLHNGIDDETIMEAALEEGALEKDTCSKLGGLFEWVKAHALQIEKLIKRLMKLMSLL